MRTCITLSTEKSTNPNRNNENKKKQGKTKKVQSLLFRRVSFLHDRIVMETNKMEQIIQRVRFMELKR